jgi:hypothetical protein
MRMSNVKRVVFVGLALLAVFTNVPQHTLGLEMTVNTSIQDTVIIANNSYDAYLMPVSDLQELITVSVTAASLHRLDFILTVDSEYDHYKARSAFLYLASYSEFNTSSDGFTLQANDTPYGKDTYVLIIDNVNWTKPGASPNGNATYTIHISRFSSTSMVRSMFYIMFAAIAVIATVVLCAIAYAIYDGRKRRREDVKKPAPPQYIVFCPTCALPAKYIEKYKRYYCKNEKKYLPKNITPQH